MKHLYQIWNACDIAELFQGDQYFVNKIRPDKRESNEWRYFHFMKIV